MEEWRDAHERLRCDGRCEMTDHGIGDVIGLDLRLTGSNGDRVQIVGREQHLEQACIERLGNCLGTLQQEPAVVIT